MNAGLRCGWLLLLSLLAANTIAQQPYEVFDTTGKHYFFSPPERVVVTDWTALDNLLELGVVPIGAPEIVLYQNLVRLPLLPEAVSDIGLRQAPGLSLIQTLQPDVIIIGTGQKELVRPFSRISKVMYYKSFSDRYRRIGEKARERFLQIADLFRKGELAEKKLAAMDTRLLELSQQLQDAYQQDLPRVLIAKPLKDDKWLVYGENSLVGIAASALGLRNVMDMGFQGEKTLSSAELQLIDYDYAMLLDQPPADKLSPQKSLQLTYTWPYGGALSVGRFAESIATVLLDQTN